MKKKMDERSVFVKNLTEGHLVIGMGLLGKVELPPKGIHEFPHHTWPFAESCAVNYMKSKLCSVSFDEPKKDLSEIIPATTNPDEGNQNLNEIVPDKSDGTQINDSINTPNNLDDNDEEGNLDQSVDDSGLDLSDENVPSDDQVSNESTSKEKEEEKAEKIKELKHEYRELKKKFESSKSNKEKKALKTKLLALRDEVAKMEGK